MTTDKNSEKFFKVFYDRMRTAQAEIKATVSVNTADSLSANKSEEENKDTVVKEETPKKKRKHVLNIIGFGEKIKLNEYRKLLLS